VAATRRGSSAKCERPHTFRPKFPSHSPAKAGETLEPTSNATPTTFVTLISEQGTFTLTEVRRRYSRQYLSLLKRGQIHKLEDYYLLKGILEGGGIEPGANEREKIASMLAAYEAKSVGP
jgi:hypothetical protein